MGAEGGAGPGGSRGTWSGGTRPGSDITAPLRASLVTQTLKICLQCGTAGLHPWVRKIPRRRESSPTPVFLPGEFHGQRSLTGYNPRGRRVGDDWATSRGLLRDPALRPTLRLRAVHLRSADPGNCPPKRDLFELLGSLVERWQSSGCTEQTERPPQPPAKQAAPGSGAGDRDPGPPACPTRSPARSAKHTHRTRDSGPVTQGEVGSYGAAPGRADMG